jgi:hypothetical protein
MSPDSSTTAPATSSGETSRRRLLALLGAGGAAGIATLLSEDEARGGHDGTNTFHLGQFNHSLGSTSLANNGSGTTLQLFKDAGAGEALFLQGKGNIESCASGPAFNVVNCVADGIAVHAFAEVLGTDPNSEDPVPPNGWALVVNGRSVFSTVGSAVIAAGAESAFVPDLAVADTSHITVTLTSNPGPRQLGWVERSPGSGFTVHLTPAPRKQRPETTLTYMVAEPLEVIPPELI